MAALQLLKDFEAGYPLWKEHVVAVKRKIVLYKHDSEQVKGLVRCLLAAADTTTAAPLTTVVPDSTWDGHPHEAEEAAE